MNENRRGPEHTQVRRAAAKHMVHFRAMTEFVLIMEGACPSCVNRLQWVGDLTERRARYASIGWCHACHRGYSAARWRHVDPTLPGWWFEMVSYDPSGNVAGSAGWVEPDRTPVAA